MKKIFRLIGIALVVACVLMFSSPAFAAQRVGSIPSGTGASEAERMAERLSKAVQFQTVSYDEGEKFNKKVFTNFQTYLKRSFPKVHGSLKREIVGDYSLLYTWKGKDDTERPVLLAAHMDVVPAEPEPGKNWIYPPFQGRIADGFIWGRGTLDDKVSVLGILEAVEKLLREEFVPRRTIYIAFGHDEEIGGQHGAAQIAELLKARGVKLDYVLDEGLTITEQLVSYISKPVAMIGIAEKGCMSMELSVESEAGHSSMPPKQTAIGILSSAISKLEKDQFPARMETPVKKMFETLSPEMPLGLRLVFANLWLFESLVKKELASMPRSNALIRTTVAPTIFQAGVKENVLAAKARAIVNYRILPGDTIDTVLMAVKDTINDSRVKVTLIEGMQSNPSGMADTESRGYKTIAATIHQVFPGTLVAPGLVLAITDSRHYASITDNILHFSPIRLRPDDLPRIHGMDERISVEDYVAGVNFYGQLIRNE